MELVINTFSDLLHIVETHPEWRRRLVRVLFPDIDVPKAFQNLAESQQRMDALLEHLNTLYGRSDKRMAHIESDVAELKSDVAVLKSDVTVLKSDVAVLKSDVAKLKADVAKLKSDVAELKADVAELKADVALLKSDVAVLKTDMREVKHTQGELKGSVQELLYNNKANAIFGRYLKRGRDATNRIADQLHAAEEADQITEQEFTQVMAADLLWEGRLRRGDSDVILVVEASWLAEISDVERAVARADILRRIGLHALPVVTGREWTEEATASARERSVVMVTDGMIDAASWRQALVL